MTQVKQGQCGLCAHFGEQHPSDSKLVQIRLKHEAPEGLVDESVATRRWPPCT